MEPGVIIDEIGGGLNAVVIVVLAMAVVVLYRRLNALQDQLLDTVLTLGAENRDLQASTNATLAASNQVISANTEATKLLALEVRR